MSFEANMQPVGSGLHPTGGLQKYRILGLLARGGMGEVYLARHEGPGGFAKTLVIKQILTHLAAEEHFVNMFLNEARLAALLSHPNIVQIFELGHTDQTYYIAMEYIHGRSLRAVKRKLQEQGMSLPPPIAALIAAETLGALHYAHTLRDDEGQPLHIVHRDVTPENILVGFNGVVKLVDFGIAKASVLSGNTREGMFKGKFSYMAPEQFTSEPLDYRIDIYAMGAVLYEMLSGNRPFIASSEAALIKSIMHDPVVPLREASVRVPEALDAIVLKALEKDPKDRFQSAEEMRLALEEYVHSTTHKVTTASVSALIKEIFGKEALQTTMDRVMSVPPRSSAYATPVPGAGPEVHRSGAGSGSVPTPSLISPTALRGSRPGLLPLQDDDDEVIDMVSVVTSEERGRSLGGEKAAGLFRWVALGLVLGLLLVVGTFLLMRSSPTTDTEPAEAMRGSAPPPLSAPTPVRPQPSTSTTPSPVASSTAESRAAAPAPLGDAPTTPDEAFDRSEGPVPSAHSGGSSSSSSSSKGASHTHRSSSKKAAPHPPTHAVSAPPTAAGARMGTALVRVNPWADVTVDGRSLGQTPLDPVRLPAGKHVFLFKNPQLGVEKRLEVEVAPDAATLIRADLLE